MHRACRLSLVFVLFAAALGLAAQTIPAVGEPFPTLAGQDQHGADLAVAPGVRHVLVSLEMKPGQRANTFLAKQGAGYLERHNALMVANIHGMPGFVAKTFALPKMRKYPHRILLVDTAGPLADWPAEEDRVTVFDLDPAGHVTAIRFWDPTGAEGPF